TLLDKLYFSVLASCTVFSLFNELVVARFSNGAAKVRIIFKLPNLFAKFFHFFVSASVFIRTLSLLAARFSNGSAKVRLISKLPNFL
ncbi:MAG: hypothetical protein IKY95_04985, partial [Bacteroidales bacterium]|nr:hypothetical protein [Bacteroidales bacterium]